MLIANSLS